MHKNAQNTQKVFDFYELVIKNVFKIVQNKS